MRRAGGAAKRIKISPQSSLWERRDGTTEGWPEGRDERARTSQRKECPEDKDRCGGDERACDIPILTRASFLIQIKIWPPLHDHSLPGFLRPSRALSPIPEKHLMKTKPSNKHRGSDLKDFFAEETILPEVEALAMKKAIALQLQRIVEE